MKVYFAGSIRGGREDAKLYEELIQYIQQEHIVLTEHIGKSNLDELEKDQSDQDIYEQDINWLKQADLVIAECTTASLGVGYELAFAEKLNIPVFVFYNANRSHLSAMISGDEYFEVFPYSSKQELIDELSVILTRDM